MPLGETSYGSIRRLSYADGKVKVQNKRNTTEMELALYNAGAIDEFGNAKFSDRDPDAVKVNQLLQKQNAELRKTYVRNEKKQGRR